MARGDKRFVRYDRRPGEADDAWLLRRITGHVEYDLVGGCWLWSGSTAHDGYGKMQHQGKWFSAHRASYLVHVNDPKGFHVLHKCDVRVCVNPNHLFLGTHADNMADMYNKKRSGKRKAVKPEEKSLILRLKSSGMSNAAISRASNRCASVILKVFRDAVPAGGIEP